MTPSDPNIEAWQAFHANEMAVGDDPIWSRFVREVEKALGLKSERNRCALDGDEKVDGFSLDSANDFFASGLTVEDYVVEVRANQERIAAANTAEYLDQSKDEPRDM